MKKLFFLFILLGAGLLLPAMAQDDDVYFVPSKKQRTTEQKNETFVRQRTANAYRTVSESDLAGSLRDVDEYNRRGRVADVATPVDSVVTADEEWIAGTYTDRIVRFHAPRAGVYVSSPFYGSYIDVYLDDPFFYDWTWAHSYVWSPFWYYGWGWNSFWYPAWNWGYHPWYPVWGHYPWHPGWHHGGIAMRPGGNVYYNGKPQARPGNFGRGTYSGGSRFTGVRTSGGRGFRGTTGTGSRGIGIRPSSGTRPSSTAVPGRPSTTIRPDRNTGTRRTESSSGSRDTRSSSISVQSSGRSGSGSSYTSSGRGNFSGGSRGGFSGSSRGGRR